MRITLVRHGEMAGDPFCEPEQPVRGCLSEKGVKQAQAARDALADTQFDYAFSSSYGRALQTCETVLEGRDTPITILDSIIEWMPDRSLENVPGTKFEEIQQQAANLYAEETWKTELGEGCFDMYARIVPGFLKALAGIGIHNRMGGYVPDKGAEGHSVAFFAHGGSLNVLLSFILGIQPFPHGRFSFQLTGTAVINFAEKKGIYYPALVIPEPH